MTVIEKTLARLPLRAARPQALRGVYACPEKEFTRLHREHRLQRIAHGTYILPPDTARPTWRPEVEVAAMAYAVTIPGLDPVLYGISAARWWHAVPRALLRVIVAAKRQHRPVNLEPRGTVLFTMTDTDKLQTMPVDTRLGKMRVTTPEQTLITLVARPELGTTADVADEAITHLIAMVNHDWTRTLLRDQPATVARAVEHALKEAAK